MDEIIGYVMVIVGVILLFTPFAAFGPSLIAAGIGVIAAGMALGALPNANRRKIKANIRSNVEPRKLVYGTTSVAGPLLYAETLLGEESEVEDFLYRITVLTGHPINRIKSVWLADQQVSLGNLPNLTGTGTNTENFKLGNKLSTILGVTQTEPGAPDSAEAIAIRKLAGSAWALGGTVGQSVNNRVVSDSVALNSTRKLNDCAYLFTRLQMVEDGWTQIPTMKAEIEGKLIRDAGLMRDVQDAFPTETPAQIWARILADSNLDPVFDNNSANCILDFLMDEIMGLGVPLEEINLTSFGDARDACAGEVWSETVLAEGFVNAGTNTAVTGLTNGTTYSMQIPSLRSREKTIADLDQMIITLPDTKTLRVDISTREFLPFGPFKNIELTILDILPGFVNGVLLADIKSAKINTNSGTVTIVFQNGYNPGAGQPTIDYTRSFVGESARYTANGMVYGDAAPIQTIEELLSSCAGRIVYTQGKYKLYPGVYESPHADILTEDDLAGPITVVTAPPRNERFNAVKGVFSDIADQYELKDFPQVKNDFYRIADAGSDDYGNTDRNGYSFRDLELPFTTSEDTAVRIAKLILDRARQSLTISVTCKPTALRWSAGDNIIVDLGSIMMGDRTDAHYTPATFGAVTTSAGAITAIAVIDGGSGYYYPPEIGVTLGTQANLVPIMVNGSINSITVTNGGINYTNSSVASVGASFDNKVFKIERWAGTKEGNIEMTLREDAAAIYDPDSPEFQFDPAPDFSASTSLSRITPTNLRLRTGGSLRDEDGRGQISGIEATWDAGDSTSGLMRYDIELGEGAEWSNKIKEMSVGAAQTTLDTDRVPTIGATVTYEWIPINGNFNGDNVEAFLDVKITAPGTDHRVYSIEKNYTKKERHYYTVHIVDDEIGGSTNTARVTFLIVDGGLDSVVRIELIDGDFADIGIQTVTSLVIKAPFSSFYSSLVSFELNNTILRSADARVLAGFNGPYTSYIFDEDLVFSSHVGGHPDLVTSVGTSTIGTFAADTTSIPSGVSLNSSLLKGVWNDGVENLVDLTSSTRAYSVQVVITIDALAATKRDFFSIGNSGGNFIFKLNYLAIDTGTQTVITADKVGVTTNQASMAGKTVANSSVGQLINVVYTERGTEASGSSRRSLYINGILIDKVDIVDLDHLITDANEIKVGDISVEGTNITVAAVNIYDKELTETEILEMNFRLLDKDLATGVVFQDFEVIEIDGIDQPEFNGFKGKAESFAMSSNTLGSFRIDKIRDTSSYVPDTDGFPGANIATWGGHVMVEGDVSIMYTIDSIVRTTFVDVSTPTPSPLNTVTFTDNITGSTAIEVGDFIQVFGVYDENQEEEFSGRKLVEIVTLNGGNIESVGWYSPNGTDVITASSASFVNKAGGQLKINSPAYWTQARKYPREPRVHTFYGDIIQDAYYTVRVRGVGRTGNVSPWVYATTVATLDVSAPNSIFFEASAGSGARNIIIDIDLNVKVTDADVTSADTEWHHRDDLDFVELVMAGPYWNRWGFEDPTVTSAASGVEIFPGLELEGRRVFHKIPIPVNSSSFLEGKITGEFKMNFVQDWYVWARMVTRAGVKSKWYPNTGGGVIATGEKVLPDVGSTTNLMTRARTNDVDVAGATGGEDSSNPLTLGDPNGNVWNKIFRINP